MTLHGSAYVSGYHYKFNVDHSYRGTASEGEFVSIGSGNSSCGYQFQVGSRYIVFAGRSPNGHLGTSKCSMTTRWTDEFAKQLDEQVHSPQKTAKLFGTVSKRAGKMANNAPMGGIILTLDPETISRRTTSDERGHYEFNDVAPGEHALKVVAPNGYKVNWSKSDLPENESTETVHLDASGCLVSNFVAMINGEVSGQFTDHLGHEMPIQLLDTLPSEVEIIPSDPADHEFYSANVNKKDGTFSIDGIPEGRYLLAHNVVGAATLQGPFFPTYYPGTSRREDATVIAIPHGGKVRNLKLRLGERRAILKFEAIVTSEDHAPIENAEVRNSHFGTAFLKSSEVIDSTKTDAAGHANLNAFLDEREDINAYWNCKPGGEQLHGYEKFTFDHASTEPIHIVLAGKCSSK
jgi:hypothetical protein